MEASGPFCKFGRTFYLCRSKQHPTTTDCCLWIHNPIIAWVCGSIQAYFFSMKNDLARLLLRQFSKRQIAYHPVYRTITGSTTAGILLSQLMYWWDKMDGNEFYKTDAELIEETAMTIDEIKGAKARLKSFEFVSITRKGVPAKTYYSIDLDGLIQAIAQTGTGDSHQPDSGNSTNWPGQNPPTITIDYSKDYTIEHEVEISPSSKTKNTKGNDGERPISYQTDRINRISDSADFMAYENDLRGLIAKHDKALRLAISQTDKGREEFLETFVHWCYTSKKEFTSGGAGLPELFKSHAKFIMGDGKKVLSPTGLDQVVAGAIQYCSKHWVKPNGKQYTPDEAEHKALETILSRKHLTIDELRICIYANSSTNTDWAYSWQHYANNPGQLREHYEARKHIGEKKMKKIEVNVLQK